MQAMRLKATQAVLAAVCAIVATAASAAPPNPIQLPGETVKLKSSTLPGYAIAQQKCAMCHSVDYIAYQPPGMTVSQWTAEMTKMQHLYGAPIDDSEIKLLGIYLAATYGDAASVTMEDRATTDSAPVEPTTSRPGAAGAPAAAGGAIDVHALLNANACLGCHAIAQKVVGPAYHDVAAKYKADPGGVEKVITSIKSGSSGKWGAVPMPPFAQLTNAELKALAEFVLKQ
ncbi:SorB family sulfite dehydrogenase c-type cytochrome subunit [Schauerella aestuarii]|uniref:SorB family sulfite dehydrogenase c-type cytochrome subunit n=1 Tax=Schauerella aestuarii TaxID=2511204 RepID=UPI001371483E|nr:c-type cytochrome [Achromobacter aestuarii]MYZ42516.1 cytochrome C552 [Achromobacter aestuarii]